MKTPDIIKQVARELRKNMTPSEKTLWSRLRYDFTGYRFLRQKPLYVYTEDSGLDRFIIPDFYCHDVKLIIEVDGKIHNIPEILNKDEYKENLVYKIGFSILRFTNEQVEKDIDTVILEIKNKLS